MTRLLLAFLALPLFISLSDAAWAQKRIGVRDFVIEGPLPAGADAAHYGRDLADALASEMSRLLREDPEFKGCEATAERTTATEPGVDGITHLVDGKVAVSGPDASYSVDARTASGPLKSSGGQFAIADLSTFAATTVALDLLKAVCDQPEAASKASRIKIDFNDLSIDQIVCDIHKPFKLSGLGATRNIHFLFTPTSKEGGDWTLAGTAAGVVWSGEGTYTFPMLSDGFGAIELKGAWRLTSPMGVYGTSDTMVGTVMPDEDACKQMY